MVRDAKTGDDALERRVQEELEDVARCASTHSGEGQLWTARGVQIRCGLKRIDRLDVVFLKVNRSAAVDLVQLVLVDKPGQQREVGSLVEVLATQLSCSAQTREHRGELVAIHAPIRPLGPMPQSQPLRLKVT